MFQVQFLECHLLSIIYLYNGVGIDNYIGWDLKVEQIKIVLLLFHCQPSLKKYLQRSAYTEVRVILCSLRSLLSRWSAGLGPVVKQDIRAGVCVGMRVLPLCQGEKKVLEFQYRLQGLASSDLTSFRQAPPPKGLLYLCVAEGW